MNDEYYMQQALKEAQRAFDEDEIPIGAVIVMNNKVIARGHNQTERLNDCTAHAEIIALTSAFNHLGSKYLPEATLYVTIEPCLMCAGALYWSKIDRVVFGAEDLKNGYRRGLVMPGPDQGQGTEPVVPEDGRRVSRIEQAAPSVAGWPFHPKTTLLKGVLQEECASLMRDFFRSKRG